jgi:hypothetical protein
MMEALQISQDSKRQALNAGVHLIDIPDNASGNKAKYIYVAADARGAKVRPAGPSSVVSTYHTIPGNSYVILNVAGYTQLHVSQLGAGGVLAMSPLDNQ